MPGPSVLPKLDDAFFSEFLNFELNVPELDHALYRLYETIKFPAVKIGTLKCFQNSLFRKLGSKNFR